MEVLAAVVAAVRHAGAVQCRVGPVKLLLSVTLHEEVDRHHSCTLETQTKYCNVTGYPVCRFVDSSSGNIIWSDSFFFRFFRFVVKRDVSRSIDLAF